MRCGDCIHEKTALVREIESLLIKAKQQAIEDHQPKAICYQETTGLFIADATIAFRERFQIWHVVTGLQ